MRSVRVIVHPPHTQAVGSLQRERHPESHDTQHKPLHMPKGVARRRTVESAGPSSEEQCRRRRAADCGCDEGSNRHCSNHDYAPSHPTVLYSAPEDKKFITSKIHHKTLKKPASVSLHTSFMNFSVGRCGCVLDTSGGYCGRRLVQRP